MQIVSIVEIKVIISNFFFIVPKIQTIGSIWFCHHPCLKLKRGPPRSENLSPLSSGKSILCGLNCKSYSQLLQIVLKNPIFVLIYLLFNGFLDLNGGVKWI